MQSNDLRRNLLQEVVQDHDRGLIGKYTMANGVKEKLDPTQDLNSQDTSQGLTPLNKLD